MKFLRRVINNWFNFAIHRHVYNTVYSVLSECLWKNFTGNLGGIQTHDLLLRVHRILAGLSSSGKLGGLEVKMSALVSRRSWVAESPV